VVLAWERIFVLACDERVPHQRVTPPNDKRRQSRNAGDDCEADFPYARKVSALPRQRPKGVVRNLVREVTRRRITELIRNRASAGLGRVAAYDRLEDPVRSDLTLVVRSPPVLSHSGMQFRPQQVLAHRVPAGHSPLLLQGGYSSQANSPVRHTRPPLFSRKHEQVFWGPHLARGEQALTFLQAVQRPRGFRRGRAHLWEQHSLSSWQCPLLCVHVAARVGSTALPVNSPATATPASRVSTDRRERAPAVRTLVIVSKRFPSIPMLPSPGD